MFPWKYSPFDQTKPALFPLSVTRSCLPPAGPESFLPIKPGLKASCTPEASATACSLQHTTCQKPASIRAHKGCKTSCAERKKKKKKKCQEALPNTFCLFAHMPNALQSFAGGIWKLPRSSPGKQGPSFCQHPGRRAGTELMLPGNCGSFETSAKTLGCLMPLGRKLSSEAQFNSSPATESFAVARLLPQFPHREKNVSMSFTQLSWALKGHPLLNHIVWKQSRETGKCRTWAILLLKRTWASAAAWLCCPHCPVGTYETSSSPHLTRIFGFRRSSFSQSGMWNEGLTGKKFLLAQKEQSLVRKWTKGESWLRPCPSLLWKKLRGAAFTCCRERRETFKRSNF